METNEELEKMLKKYFNEIRFFISEEDLNKLTSLKAEAGRADITESDYVKEILEETLHNIKPKKDGKG